jgi:hypothetical protein
MIIKNKDNHTKFNFFLSFSILVFYSSFFAFALSFFRHKILTFHSLIIVGCLPTKNCSKLPSTLRLKTFVSYKKFRGKKLGAMLFRKKDDTIC